MGKFDDEWLVPSDRKVEDEYQVKPEEIERKKVVLLRTRMKKGNHKQTKEAVTDFWWNRT